MANKYASGMGLKKELELLRLINSMSFDFTFLYDCNENTAVVTRYVDGEISEPEVISNFTEYLLGHVHQDDVSVLLKEFKKITQTVVDFGFEIRLKEMNGRRYRWHSVKMRLASDGFTYVGASNYIDRLKNKETELTIKARQDPLTGLLNKVVTKDLINDYIKKNADEECALIVFDIDNFKDYNDTLGHLMGDEIIKECAARIRRAFSKDSYVGRIGGDEFVVFIKNLSDVATIVTRMGKLRDSFSDFLLGNRRLKVTASIGISLYPDMGSNYDELFQSADMALYSIKNNGRNSYAFYTDELYNDDIHGRASREMFEKRKRHNFYIQNFDKAIENEEFYVVLQPKVSGHSNSLVGAEALVRWQMMDGTDISPEEFLPAFEKNGSIVKLDFYVYEKVFAYIRSRLDEGKRVLPVSMNVSKYHILTDNFVNRMRELIDKYQVPTQFVELEFTESLYLENLNTINEILDKLRNMGIKISMDDFGSGYSSLNALNNLKIDLLKIDKVFMHDKSLKDSDKTILKFIIGMAKNLSMKVLCEGVETTEQRAFLNEAGCDIHQGFLYSKPVLINTFNDFIDNEDMLFAKVG